jgi:hypothetical protein
MSCWDCHAQTGATGTINDMVTSHGSTTTIRGAVHTPGTTAATNLCINCHITTYASTGTNHPAGSAFQGGASNMNAATFSNCSNCHSYGAPAAAAGLWNTGSPRPIRAEDAHGFNDRSIYTAGSKWVNGASSHRPYAFIRNTLTYWSPTSVSTAGETLQRSRGCTGTSGICNNNMGTTTTYGAPGGVY